MGKICREREREERKRNLDREVKGMKEAEREFYDGVSSRSVYLLRRGLGITLSEDMDLVRNETLDFSLASLKVKLGLFWLVQNYRKHLGQRKSEVGRSKREKVRLKDRRCLCVWGERWIDR